MLKQQLLACVFALAMASAAPVAHATVLDFDDLSGAGPIITSNYFSQGFRISPNGHFDAMEAFTDFAGTWASTWFGFDASGGCPATFNPNFLGPASLAITPGSSNCGYVFVDYSEQPFSLTGLDVVWPGWSVASSNGGLATSALPDFPAGVLHPHMSFTGAQWTDVSWLLFYSASGGPVGLGNLAFKVPVPGTLALLSVAFAGFAVTRRRKS
jgi:hypothetical protein